VLRRLKTWSHFILTAYPDFEGLIGQEADRRRKLYNSRIECTYYQFHGPRPEFGGAVDRTAARTPILEESEIPVPVEDEDATAATAAMAATAKPDPSDNRVVQAFGGLSQKAGQQADIFRNRLLKRARHLRRWPTRRGITCYRLYDRDVPEVPLAVDRYEDCLHIAEYDRPHDRTPAEHADWLDLMVRTAGQAMDVEAAKIFLKRRARQRGTQQYERYADAKRIFEVSEGGLKFEVNLSDYVDTGLFLDHRITRSMVGEAARGKRFLNLFGYTGAFSVYAAAGGALSTVTVDLSNTYLEWARRNMNLNGLDGPSHRFVPSDAMNFLTDLPEVPCYDLAVVDPPTFSNSKKTDAVWDVQRDYAGLLNCVLGRMVPGGVIFFSTNFRRFKLAEGELRGASVREISRKTVPEDYRNQRIHRCWRIVRDGGGESK
jgi:23S rRNA (guanine2445-N2)-methyltransferase / 23S rRNA (guanine2069-N7)-methyltransferase